MKRRQTVFDSESEASVFRTLESRWSKNFALYPSLPLSKIIELDERDLDETQRRFFYATNVDYTLCHAGSGRPLLSVEFDGIGGGFNRDGVYVPVRGTPDPCRDLKMNLKLQLARAVEYPLIIVSYEEVEPLDEDDCLTVLDGIIGQLLAHEESGKILNEMLRDCKDAIESLPDGLKEEYTHDLVLQAEVAAELRNDPIARKAAEYLEACVRSAFVRGWRVEYMDDPPLPALGDPADTLAIESRVEAMKDTKRVGCRIAVETVGQPILLGAWVRNIDDYGVSPTVLAENIAKYLAFKMAHSIMLKREQRVSRPPGEDAVGT